MELTDTITIAAPIRRVYPALHDAEILQKCIPGCETVIKHSGTLFEGIILLKIGPIKYRIQGTIRVNPYNPPHQFRLTACSNGDKKDTKIKPDVGHVDITLSENKKDNTTNFTYKAHTERNGKILKFGKNLIKKIAKRLAIRFFDCFEKCI